MTEPTDAEIWQMWMPMVRRMGVADPVEFARAVLAKWGTPAPVGVEPALHQYQASDGTWNDFDSERHRRDTVAAGYPVRTLYTVTQTGAGAVPLTEQVIETMWCDHWDGFVSFAEAEVIVRATEEAHRSKQGGQHV